MKNLNATKLSLTIDNVEYDCKIRSDNEYSIEILEYDEALADMLVAWAANSVNRTRFDSTKTLVFEGDISTTILYDCKIKIYAGHFGNEYYVYFDYYSIKQK